MMALTGRKLCKLDAICARLKQINQEPAHEHKDESRGVPIRDVPNNFVASYGSNMETQDEPADLSLKPKKCLNNNIEDYSIHNEKADTNAQDLTVLYKNLDKAVADQYGYNKDISHSNSESEFQQSKMDERNTCPKERTPTSSIKSSPSLTPISSSRRKSRKASTPRSIVQIQKTYNNFNHVDEKDELAEYEINNQNTDFPPEEGDEENDKNSYNSSHDSLGGSNENLETSKSSRETDRTSEISKSSEVYSFENGAAPLDLSVGKPEEHSFSVGKTEEQSSNNDYFSSDDDEDGNSMDRNLVIDEAGQEKTNNSSTSLSSPTDSRKECIDTKANAAHLKDYAESTMNELISMYGFSRPGLSSDLTRHFPIHGYDSLLQQVNGLVPVKKEPLAPATNHVQHVNGSGGSHDGSQPIKGIFTNTQSHSPASPLIKAEGKSVYFLYHLPWRVW